ncbi:MAG: hypothetical protein QXM92_02425 [Candidatus Anstonellales archaeon]
MERNYLGLGHYNDGIDCDVEEFKALLDEIGRKRRGAVVGGAGGDGGITDDRLVILFTQAGCNACSTFLSRLNRELQKRGGGEVGGGGRRGWGTSTNNKIIVLEVKEREGIGGGEGEEDECTLIHDMMHISSTPTVYYYSNRTRELKQIDLSSVSTIDEAVRLVLAKLDSLQ